MPSPVYVLTTQILTPILVLNLCSWLNVFVLR